MAFDGGKKKKITVIGMVVILVVGAFVGTIVTVRRNNKQVEINTQKAGGKKTALIATTAVVIIICKYTDFRRICEETLQRLGIGKVPRELMTVSFSAAVEGIQGAIESSYPVREAAKDPMAAKAVDLCKELLDCSIEDLKRALDRWSIFDRLSENVINLRVWLSGAVTYQETCLDAFENTTGDSGVRMRKLLEFANKLTRNSLAMLDGVSFILENSPLRSDPRRVNPIPGQPIPKNRPNLLLPIPGQRTNIPGQPTTIIPGQDTIIPGQDTIIPGQPKIVPGQDTIIPGQPKIVPGQPKIIPGQDTIIPGQPKIIPGQDTIIPGQPKIIPGQQTIIRGQPVPNKPIGGTIDWKADVTVQHTYTKKDGTIITKGGNRRMLDDQGGDSTYHYSTKLQMVGDEEPISNAKPTVIDEDIKQYPSWADSSRRSLIDVDPKTLKPNAVVAQDGSGNFKTITEACLCTAVNGDGFIAKDIWIENTAGPEKHQAVALRVSADMTIFHNCVMDGYQDTLYTHSYRQFYRQCNISGTIDFVFGDAAAVFQDCKLIVKKPMDNQECMVTAQGRKDRHSVGGLVLQGCTITADPEFLNANPKPKSFLGRPWKEFSRTVIMQSFIDQNIAPEGWSPWTGNFGQNTCYYAEFNNKGPGANTAQRVKWMGVKKINPRDAERFTPGKYIQGDGWIPQAGVPYDSGMMKV
ncbi:Pectinesterase, active site-containing protein [Cynara cardunculus var. scolymus]|uniref:Pectinesterase n=1 Tax=Cynara cardunculus var. scolymus TaxID=59895 RepID=A0A103XFK7_CYNCS|nr:Pectinesterase, active site-containing protein [Cynara cardunculus var. scolymus]